MSDLISRQAAIDALTKTSGIRGDALKALYDLPLVNPQEPILDKIRAEMLNDWQIKKFPSSPFSCGLRYAVEIIDKYRGESDCRECKAEHDCYECKKYAESEER